MVTIKRAPEEEMLVRRSLDTRTGGRVMTVGHYRRSQVGQWPLTCGLVGPYVPGDQVPLTVLPLQLTVRPPATIEEPGGESKKLKHVEEKKTHR